MTGVARSVAEAHLYLDLLGWDRAGRTQSLTERGGELITVYQGGPGQRVELRVPVPEPVEGRFGGPDPSTLISRDQWVAWADALARTVAAAPAPAERPRLRLAAEGLREALKFGPDPGLTARLEAWERL